MIESFTLGLVVCKPDITDFQQESVLTVVREYKQCATSITVRIPPFSKVKGEELPAAGTHLAHQLLYKIGTEIAWCDKTKIEDVAVWLSTCDNVLICPARSHSRTSAERGWILHRLLGDLMPSRAIKVVLPWRDQGSGNNVNGKDF